MHWTYYTTDPTQQQQAREWAEYYGCDYVLDSSGTRVVAIGPDCQEKHPGKILRAATPDERKVATCPGIILANARPPEPLTEAEAQDTEAMIRQRKPGGCGGCD